MSDADTWLTPPAIIEAPGPFELDPCAAKSQPWATAKCHFTKSDNGLRRRWRGMVWLNPPYSNVLPWVEKLADLDDGIALIPASTGARYWQEIIFSRAISIFFIKKRLNFLTVTGEPGKFQSGFSVALAAFGGAAGQRLSSLEGREVLQGRLIQL